MPDCETLATLMCAVRQSFGMCRTVQIDFNQHSTDSLRMPARRTPGNVQLGARFIHVRLAINILRHSSAGHPRRSPRAV